ncbi:MAG: hypothetical protein RLZZ227_2272 [Pseudomonadota bacterium]|jgi:hypothetical protein
MKATELLHKRVVFADNKFAELVLWQLSRPLRGSRHTFKYRLAYVVNEVCVLRYDNEAGKGDHRHEGHTETPYKFISPEKLLSDFQQDIARWEHENRRA